VTVGKLARTGVTGAAGVIQGPEQCLVTSYKVRRHSTHRLSFERNKHA